MTRQSKWIPWLAVLAGLLAVCGGVGGLLLVQGYTRAGVSAIATGGVAGSLWILWGLWCWRDRLWAKWLFWWLTGGLAVFSLAGLAVAAGRDGAALALVGAWVMSAAFMLGLWLLRLALSPGVPIIGVARTLLDEAIRMKLALVFIVGLIALLPMLPWMVSGESRLAYRIQNLLNWSLIGASVMLSLMTIFLACGTICNEMYRKQIYLTLTKPISRLEYLLGKWLGIVTLNLLLLVIVGAGVVVFARLLQTTQEPLDDYDAFTVDQQILVARDYVRPDPPSDLNLEDMKNRLIEQIRAENRDDTNFELSPQARREVENTAIYQWHTVPPGGDRGYLFRNLASAKERGGAIQLRLNGKPAFPASGQLVRLAIMVNGRLWPQPFGGVYRPVEIPENIPYTLDLPATLIDHEGKLEIRIRNLDEPTDMVTGSVTFERQDGMQLLYPVGPFEVNLAKGLVVIWLRLAFLAMLGLAAGTFLGFPVAALAALLVYIVSAASGFLGESMSYFASFGGEELTIWQRVAFVAASLVSKASQGEIYEVVKIIARAIGSAFMFMVPSFAQFNPTPELVDGRNVPTAMVTDALLKVGVVWTVLCALVGWLIFRARELARVTV